MSTRNFYEILNAQPNAAVDELKSHYKQLILQCHPDKLQQQKNTKRTAAHEINRAAAAAAAADDDPNAETDRQFVAINEAWNTLKDPAKRKLYDAELLLTKFQTHSNIYERLKLSDMKRSSSSNSSARGVQVDGADETFYTYDCRCGGQYIVDESADNEMFQRSGDNDDDDDGEVIVECSECSLVIILNG